MPYTKRLWVQPWSGRVQEATDGCFSPIAVSLSPVLSLKSVNISLGEEYIHIHASGGKKSPELREYHERESAFMDSLNWTVIGHCLSLLAKEAKVLFLSFNGLVLLWFQINSYIPRTWSVLK